MLADLVVILCVHPGRTCAESGVMLARVRPGGVFELLTRAPWTRALGYRPDEFTGKSLRDLMREDAAAAGEVVSALLDETNGHPIDVTLCCKDERRKSFRFHRSFDP